MGVTTRACQTWVQGVVYRLDRGRVCIQLSGAPTGEGVSVSMAEPSARYGHVAAGVEGKVYVWGGRRSYQEVSHDGPDKTELIFSVDILDVKVSLLLIYRYMYTSV